MKKFFTTLFGLKKTSQEEELVTDLIDGVLARMGLDISYDLKMNGNNANIEFFGDDEKMMVAKEGLLIESMQTFLKRALQNKSKDRKVFLELDCCGFREEAFRSLHILAEKLKGVALSKGKPVYVRALPPKDRKVIHQYLVEDATVKSKSVGEGHFKKIKIFPLKTDRP